jgi:hypothetical protein
MSIYRATKQLYDPVILKLLGSVLMTLAITVDTLGDEYHVAAVLPVLVASHAEYSSNARPNSADNGGLPRQASRRSISAVATKQ